ncbi:hypothetical protein ACQU0X_08370 [Pseudovibrio ascidiaceicola]
MTSDIQRALRVAHYYNAHHFPFPYDFVLRLNELGLNAADLERK